MLVLSKQPQHCIDILVGSKHLHSLVTTNLIQNYKYQMITHKRMVYTQEQSVEMSYSLVQLPSDKWIVNELYSFISLLDWL